MFFSFDGIDGVGKSTQLTLFAQWLTDQRQQVVTCRDPGRGRSIAFRAQSLLAPFQGACAGCACFPVVALALTTG